MDSVFIWVLVAIVVLLVVAAFAGRRGTGSNPPTDRGTPYDRPSELGDGGGMAGPSDPGGGSGGS